MPSKSKPFQTSVALASFPRSGNTWIRFLLLSAYGLKSRYDQAEAHPETKPIDQAGLLHLLHDPAAFLVKTHDLPPVPFPFAKAILIIRDPFSAIRSYPAYAETPVSDRLPFIQGNAARWNDFNLTWIAIKPRPLVVHFEDLALKPVQTFRDIARFLDLPNLAPDVIRQAFDAVSIPVLQRQAQSTAFFRSGLAFAPITDFSPQEQRAIFSATTKARATFHYRSS